jgi:hypothetical protein
MEVLSKKETAVYQLLRDNFHRGIVRYEKHNPFYFNKRYGFTINALKSLERKGMINVATIHVMPWINSRNVWSSGVFLEVNFE